MYHNNLFPSEFTIYCLVGGPDQRSFYIGCTMLSLQVRLRQHISVAKRLSLPVHQRIREFNFDIQIKQIIKAQGAFLNMQFLEYSYIEDYERNGYKMANVARFGAKYFLKKEPK